MTSTFAHDHDGAISDPDFVVFTKSAEKEGATAGRNAAEWWIEDARLDYATDEQLERVLQGADDCDGMIVDTFPYLDLSGQWAGGPTPASVLQDIGLTLDSIESDDLETVASCSELVGVYDNAFCQAVQDTIESSARGILASRTEA